MARNLSWPRRTSPIVSSSSSPSLQRTSCRKGSEASAGAEVPTTVSHTVPSKSPTPGKLRRIWTPTRDAATASLYVESASWSYAISGAEGRAGGGRLRLSRGGGTADRSRGWLESSRKDDEKGAGALWRMRLEYRWGGSSAISLARRGWPPRRDGKTHIPSRILASSSTSDPPRIHSF